MDDHNLPWETRQAAGEEVGAEFMAELEEASESFPVAAFVLGKRMQEGCIRTAVFSLNQNTFFMDWVPCLGDAKKDKEFYDNKAAKRCEEIQNKRWAMGLYVVRHEYEPFGMYCITGADDEDPLNDYIVWRFAHGQYTSADQDFLQTVAHAMRYAPYARRATVWDGYCVEVDFWKQRDDGTYGFHFCEYVM
ncbi:MAG: hypothetical protein WBQ89_26130 [Candidatus Acidiferrum sp.]